MGKVEVTKMSDTNKTETLNLRISTTLKAKLRQAAASEHRSMANMVEHLVLTYCTLESQPTAREPTKSNAIPSKQRSKKLTQ